MSSPRVKMRSANFFFQAEDGIRYTSVTGVQTCALPIYLLGPMPIDHWLQYARKQLCDQQRQDQAYHERAALKSAKKECAQSDRNEQGLPNLAVRSEERRVGKESRPWCARARDQDQAGVT